MRLSDERRVIILLGLPGSGKGTQAQLLAKKFNLYYFDTSKVIEANLENIKKGDFIRIKKKKYSLFEEKRLREKGILMSPPLIAFWVKNKIKEIFKEGRGLATSGSPRTLYEGKEITPLLKKLYGKRNIKVILLQLSPQESIWRNSRRKTCELIFHSILYSKETARLKKCPLDGSRLIIRKDDNSETINVRLKEYRERTFPLVTYFKKQGLKVKIVNGEQSVEGVFKDILKTLK